MSPPGLSQKSRMGSLSTPDSHKKTALLTYGECGYDEFCIIVEIRDAIFNESG